jgi:hypothetical protein
MNAKQRVLTTVAVGLLLWVLSLIWPELDFVLFLAVVLGVALIVGSIELALWWRQQVGQDSTNLPRSQHPSRPVTVH